METYPKQPVDPPLNRDRTRDETPKKDRKIGWGSLIGVILGALLAGMFTVGSTFLQKQADAEQSRTSFLRDQRLQVYSAYIANLKTLKDAERDVWVFLSSTSGNNSGFKFEDPRYRPANEAMNTAISNVDLDLAKFRLVCSEPVCLTAEPVTVQHIRIRTTLFRAAGTMPIEEASKEWNDASAAAIRAEIDLVKAMQRELGISG